MENSNTNSSKKILLSVIGISILIIALVGVSFAFFNYTRTGSSNNIRVGRISFESKNEETVSLNNLFPIDPTDTSEMNDNTKVGTYSIDIKGDTDYVDGIEYLVSIADANIYTSTGKIVPISINVTTEDLGDPSANYFIERESKDTLMYKKIIGDTIVGDEMLLVGYIPQNDSIGTIEGVDGSITIKAYLDKDKILISDTYDGTESDSMGTPNSLAEGKTVFTTTEWNSLQQNGVSFKVKVEANEGIWVKGSLEEIMKVQNLNTTTNQPIRDDQQSTYVTGANGIDFSIVSSDTNGKGVYMRAGTENDTYPILYYRGEIDNNNVAFGGYCWKTVRTTDTGGVKLIYNGELSGNSCNNTGLNSQITLNISGTDTNTFAFSGDGLYKSPAYNGYMWGTVYEYGNIDWTSGAKFGSSFTWDGTNYTLVDVDTTSSVPSVTRHYSCNSSSATATCTDLRYVYYWSGNSTLDNNAYYITLQNGKGINEAIDEMQTNTTNSNAKDKIEAWYASNMSEFTSKIEDTIYCNDRRMNTLGDIAYIENGWEADGNLENDYLHYLSYGRLLTGEPTLICRKNDSFTWKNAQGNQKLQYPVAMLSSDEIMLAGGSFSNNETNFLNSGSDYWSMSPHSFYFSSAIGLRVYNGAYLNYGNTYVAYGLRPVISLKPGTPVVSGTGTVTDPYVIG